jgi:hypothetical protein
LLKNNKNRREALYMKKICSALGTFLLGLTALIAIIGPASLGGMAVEEMPEVLKKAR